MSSITEAEIATVTCEILIEKPAKAATIAELVREIPKRVRLSPSDLIPSPTRKGEAIWEQRVRNIRSHKDSRANAIYRGKLIAIPGGYALPD
jgi:hypothetical protein